ncbi:PKC domain-containing protein [Cavenderia fasciculata]|uniref:PKC domain-containing protein n=1 Tax=Cavenderia fasciculata TaxID=261658 RepID=F4PRV4_CACFS|nr:PKC domain-containing protein [Cavenderia fasciculata]EGG21390.1 PKC domain-containing protein [Cavenderia fasciculata]|eukprot:XP_004359240.1 PKC domain-containing protein [Cavenderia fasciculata]
MISINKSQQQFNLDHNHHSFQTNIIVDKPYSCKFCHINDPLIHIPSLVSTCTKCNIVVHNKCITLKEHFQNQCKNNNNNNNNSSNNSNNNTSGGQKISRSNSITCLFKKLFFSKQSPKKQFIKFGLDITSTSSLPLTLDNLIQWIKLLRFDNDRNIKILKNYDIFDNIKINQEIFDYLIGILQSGSKYHDCLSDFENIANIQNEQFISLTLLYRIMFNWENTIYFNDLDVVNFLSDLYKEYLATLNSSYDPNTHQLSLKLLTILLLLFENQTYLVLSFNSSLIETFINLSNHKNLLKESWTEQEENVLGRVIVLLGQYYHQEPFHSAIEKHPEWIDLIINYSTKNQICLVHKELQPSDIQLGPFIYESPLCVVYKGSCTGQEDTVAIKQLSVESLGFEWPLFFKETTIICLSQHPLVIKCLGAHTLQTEKPFIVTELCSRGNIIQALNSFGSEPPFELVVNMAVEASRAMNYLHSKGITHRDVKPANFLVKDCYSVKLIDFGTSKVLDQNLKMTVIGTPVYMAEEVVKGQSYENSADIYSFGIMLWEMFTRKIPFEGMNEFERINFVLKGGRPTIPDTVPIKLANLIRQCWDSNPSARPTFKQIIDCLVSIVDPVTKRSIVNIHQRMNTATLSNVFKYLDTESLLNCSRVSRQWKRSVYESICSNFKEYENIYWSPKRKSLCPIEQNLKSNKKY